MEHQKLISPLNEENPRVNKKIRICIECGNFSIQQENYGFYCKQCEKFFNFKEEQNWVKIHAGVYADTMT